MTKISQKLYKHEIVPDPTCTEMRVSLTFPLVTPEAVVPSQDSQIDNHYNQDCNLGPSGYVPFNALDQNAGTVTSPGTPPQSSANVLYISSSMLRFIDPKKTVQ